MQKKKNYDFVLSRLTCFNCWTSLWRPEPPPWRATATKRLTNIHALWRIFISFLFFREKITITLYILHNDENEKLKRKIELFSFDSCIIFFSNQISQLKLDSMEMLLFAFTDHLILSSTAMFTNIRISRKPKSLLFPRRTAAQSTLEN